MGVVFDELTSHLSPPHAAYFAKWLEMVGLEEEHSLAPRKEAFSVRSTEHEKKGSCAARMAIR